MIDIHDALFILVFIVNETVQPGSIKPIPIVLVFIINLTIILHKTHNIPVFKITDFTFIPYNFKVVRARNKNIRIGENL
jgi:hypothetical protein